VFVAYFTYLETGKFPPLEAFIYSFWHIFQDIHFFSEGSSFIWWYDWGWPYAKECHLENFKSYADCFGELPEQKFFYWSWGELLFLLLPVSVLYNMCNITIHAFLFSLC
jgi:hypothetical protein